MKVYLTKEHMKYEYQVKRLLDVEVMTNPGLADVKYTIEERDRGDLGSYVEPEGVDEKIGTFLLHNILDMIMNQD